MDKAAGGLEKEMVLNLATEPEVKDFLAGRSIPVVKHRLLKEPADAPGWADEIGYPLVLKVVSREILHKSEVGGVITDIKDVAGLESAWMELVWNIADKAPHAGIEGFLLEKMAPKGVETIVGAMRDEQFGPVVMFGIGGIAVELTKDVSFSLAPVTKNEALEMMKEVRGFPLLDGFRGRRLDIDAVCDVIVKMSLIISDTDDIREIEINPLIVHEKGAVAVDARAICR